MRKPKKAAMPPLHSDFPLRTPQETADLLSISKATLYNWRKQKWGPPALELMPRTWRYRQEDIDLFLGSLLNKRADESSSVPGSVVHLEINHRR